MKLNRKNPLLLAAITLAGIAFTATSAHALTWDITDNGATIEAGSGAWDLTALNWNGTLNVAWSQTSTTSPTQAAVFAGSDGAVDSYVVTLASQMAATSLTFSNTGYQITGSTVYAAPASGAATIITVATGKTATINSALTSAASASGEQTVVINSGGILNLGGNITSLRPVLGGSSAANGAGTLNITGGTSSLTNPRFNTATMNQTGGSVSLAGSSTAGNWIGYAAGKSVNYTVSGTGTLNLNGTSGAYLSIGRTGAANNATLTVQTGGTVNIGTTASQYGQLNINGNDGNTAIGKLDVQGGNLTVGTGNAANLLAFFPQAAPAGKTALMTQSGGTVTANGIAFGGATGTYDVTAAATLQLTGGNLYVGALGIAKGSGAATLPVTIQLQGGTLGASAAWSSALDMKLTNATLRSSNSAGTAFAITLSGNLSDDTAVAGTLTKTGGGTLTLSGTNAYSGGTTLSGGTVQFAKLVSMPASGIVLWNQGTLAVNVGGTGEWTTGTSGAGTIGGLLSGVGGQGSTVTFGSPSVILGIDTSNGGNQTYSGIIANPSGTTMGLTKLGTNTLTLDQANTYSFNTTISAGTLRLENTSAVSGSSVVAVGANTLQIATDTAFSAFPNLSSQLGTIVSGRATPGVGLTHVLGDATIGNGATNFTAGSNVTSGTAAIQLGNISNNNGSTATPRLNPTTANLIITGGVTLGTSNAGTANLTLDGTGSVNSIAGAIVNGTRVTGNVIKSGTSTWTLSGPNTYSGNTTITGGTLILGATGVLPDTTPVSIGAAILNAATSGTEVAGTLDVTAAATINLGTGAKLEFADSSAIDWTLPTAGTLDITGDFVSGTSVKFGSSNGALLPAQLALISVNGSGAGTYTLDTSGYLVVGGGSAYDTWDDQITNGLILRTDDADGDGLLNIQEFLFGTSPIAGNGSLVTTSSSGGNIVLRWLQRESGATYTLKQSSTLEAASWTTAAHPPAADGDQTGAPTDYDYYTVTIPTSGGKLFFRIEGVEN